MTVELKGNFLGTHSTVSKSNGNTYYKADVYCDDGDTVRVSIPANLVESINGIKKFSEICWCVTVRNHPDYGMQISLCDYFKNN